MIFVNGLPLSSSPSQENENLTALLEHPSLVAAANLFKAVPAIKYSIPEECMPEKSSIARHVYVFQREYAIVDPAMVEFVGTDEATTCGGLVIRNQKNGMTSIAHLDTPEIVDLGLNQMLSLVIDNDIEAQLDVHLIGCFEDVVYEQANGKSGLGSREHSAGHSLPLCSKIVESLQTRRENFHIQTLCVLGHNTRRDTDGVAYPIANGFLVETSTGSIKPAIFDRSSRCPDELVRRIRVTVSSLDPQWKGRLLETYDTRNDRFQIAPCSWKSNWKYYAFSLLQYSDSEILQECSTSPSAEGPDFVKDQRRVWKYLVEHPAWRETFPLNKPRSFKRNSNGGWITCE